MPWLSLLKLYWKPAAIAGAVLLLLYTGRLWLNKHDTQVREQERVSVSEDLEKQKAMEWEERSKSLEARASELDKRTIDIQTLSVAATTRLLAAERTEKLTRETLTQVIAQAKTTQEVLSEAAKTVPVSDLPDAIRRQSSRVAAAISSSAVK
jgi:hypothetical protein